MQKNGVQWWNERDTRTSVELIDQSRCFQLVMMADRGSIVEFVKLRSAIIGLILSLKSELCLGLDASQYLIAPFEFHTVPQSGDCGQLTLLSMEDLYM